MDAHTLECLDFYRVRELLARYALTGLGKNLAIAIRPTARPELVRRWLGQVSELQRLVEARGLPPFGGISDVREIVKRCTPPLKVGVDDIALIGSTLAGTHAVAEYLRELPENCPELLHLAERAGDFFSIAQRIQAVVDERGQVRDDASPKLARIRREIESASTEITAAVERLLHDPNVRKFLQYPNHTFHGDRMVLPLRTEYRGRLAGIIHRSSDSGATLYVEPAAAVELNNQISNLRSAEAEEIARLLWELAHEVHINAEPILATLDVLAVLDLVTAKVRFAVEYELRCPQIVDEARLSLRQARHPLLMDLMRQRQAEGHPPEAIVPINARLGEDFNILIITGPNTGGKTVTLKTVGLLALMVQAGVPVPVADGSLMGVFKHILIDIGDEQSMAQSLSTFSAHLRRQMEMLQKAGPQTLVLIDELGAGTDPDEGSAIGRAILDDLLETDSRCIVTTHIGALKNYPLMRPRSENACVEFDIETLRPTYRLRIGEPGLSNAINIAQTLGMPRRLVAAARRHLSGTARALHQAMEGTVAAKRQAEEARDAAETAKLHADKAHGEAQAAREKLERQQADFQAWVARVVHLQPGDAVRVRGFDRDGRIVRMRLDLQRAEIDVGSFTVEAPLGDVLPPETPAPPPRPQRPAPPPMPPRRQRERPRPPVGQTADAGGGPRRDHGQVHDAAAAASGVATNGSPDQPAREAGAAPRPQGDAPPDRGPRRHDHRGPRQPDHHGQRQPDHHGRPDGDARQRPPIPSLTDEQATALQPGDTVYAKRFHREGRVVRVVPAKKLAVVNVGLLEVEVPFSGLGPPAPAAERRPHPPRRDRQPAGETP